MAIFKRGLAVAVLFAGLSPVACGSDSGSTGNMNDIKGSGGKGNVDTDSGTPPPPPPTGSVPCGEKNCTVPEGSTSMACCMDHFTSACGVTNGIGGCVKPPPPQPKECMPISVGGAFMFRACCTDTSICGIDTSMFPGGGCTDYATFKEMAAMYMGRGMGGMGGMGGGFGNFMITLPDTDPPCTQPPAQ